MKRYIWMGFAVMFMGAYASDNPFDIGTNLKKIDQEESALLSELKGMKGAAADTASPKISSAVKEKRNENEAQAKHSPDASKEGEIKKIKEEQARIEAARLKEEKAEQLRQKKAEAQRAEEEKREVAAYEARRAAKKKEEAQAVAGEKAGQNKKRESAKAAVAGKEAKQKSVPTNDFNITQEEIEAAKAADKAYLEAIKEVDKEEE